MSPKPLRAAHRFPIDPIIVLAPSQHQEDERAAEAKAGAAARPLVSCKAPVMCRPVRCLSYLVGGISCTPVQSDALKPSITFRALLYRVPFSVLFLKWHQTLPLLALPAPRLCIILESDQAPPAQNFFPPYPDKRPLKCPYDGTSPFTERR